MPSPYTLSITPLAVTVTRNAVGLRAARQLAVTLLAVTVTPKTIGLLRNYTATAATDALVLNGLPPGMRIVGEDGAASMAFDVYWQQLLTKIATFVNAQADLLAATQAAYNAAAQAHTAADTASTAAATANAAVTDIEAGTLDLDAITVDGVKFVRSGTSLIPAP